jgi:hypothetical protein
MADIFISYSREDRSRADQVAQALQGMGLDVFWDSEIPPGTTWADYIETKLNECKAVVVLWSEHSTKSQWVREEARMGRDKGKLIPAMIDASQSPFGFGEVQAANLSDWTGQPDHSEWRRFSEAVRLAASREKPANPATYAPPPPAPVYQPTAAPRPAMSSTPAPASGGGFSLSSIKPIWWIGGLIAVALVVVIGIVASAGHNGPAPTPPVQQAQTGQATGGPAPLPPGGGQQAATQLTAADYQRIVMERMGQRQQQMAAEGFQMLGQPTPGTLNAGQSSTVPASLNQGVEYRIVGVCDQDCGDLDLSLIDQNNVTVSQDTSTDNSPIVSVAPQWTGPFTLQVSMYQCSNQPCYFAVALFGRNIQH